MSEEEPMAPNVPNRAAVVPHRRPAEAAPSTVASVCARNCLREELPKARQDLQLERRPKWSA
jgi:hypothetical protein